MIETEKTEKNSNNKRTTRILKVFNSAIGNVLPKVHKIPMFTQKFNGKMISAKRGEVVVEFKVTPDMTNPVGFLHGGMQCTLMDDIIGLAAATLGYEGFTISLNLQVNYLGKAKVDDIIKVKAEIVREGRNIIHASSKISSADNKLIAVGQSDLLKTQINRDYVKEFKH